MRRSTVLLAIAGSLLARSISRAADDAKPARVGGPAARAVVQGR